MLRFIYILLVTYFLSLSVQAQKSTSDIAYLQSKIRAAQALEDPVDRDTQVIWQYNYISEELSRHQDPRSTLYLDTLRSLTTQSSWTSADGFYYRAMGRYHDFRGEFTDALDYYDKAIQAYLPAGGDLKELAFSYVLKGFLLSNSDLNQQTFDVFEEGLPYARAAKAKNSLCLMLDWYGDYHYYGLDGIVDNEKALEYYLQVNELLPQISYQRIIADNYGVLSGVYDRLGQIEKANYFFNLSDSLSVEHDLPYVRWALYAEKARQLDEKGRYQEANEIYLLTKEFTKETTNVEMKSRVEKALYESYKRLGNDQKALAHLEQLNKYDSIMNVTQVEQKYAEMEAKYNLAVKENEITLLEKQKSITNRNFLIGLASILLIAGALIFNKNRALAKSYNQLEAKQDEVEQAIYLGETQERQRLASELHDNVNTKLAAARWQLEAVAEKVEGTPADIVDMTINLMNEAYQDVRNISHNLVPAQLKEEGLTSAISNLVTKLNSGNHVTFNLESSDVIESRISKISYPVYNIIFELINNVMKHSNASNATIAINEDQDHLSIKIKDNGQGYDTVKSKPGFGLRSIKSRIDALHGTMSIESSAGEGTTTYVKIPLT